MTRDNFLSYLQQLLTMVDPENEYSVALAQMALEATIELARISHNTDAITYHMMVSAKDLFRNLVMNRADFAGAPGAYKQNKINRHRLRLVLYPGC